MLTKYMQSRDQRTEARTLAGTMRGGKLTPVMAVPFRESEGGTMRQNAFVRLERIAGELVTDPRLHVVSVFVPALAMDALENDTEQYAGNAEIYREKLLSGEPVFGLEVENEISKRLGVVPRSIAGQKKVATVARLAHNSAVNYLRRRKYVNAAQVEKTNVDVTPALLGQTVLDRLNGVLDPEDRVNGAVQLGSAPLKGLLIKKWGSSMVPYAGLTGMEAGDTVENETTITGYEVQGGTRNRDVQLLVEADENGAPAIRAEFAATTGQLSLDAFFTAQRMDALTREMRQLVDDNPELGEDIVARFAHGLSVDVGKQPFVLYEREIPFSQAVERPMDGASMDDLRTYGAASIEWMVPVPKTEFGGVVITFIALKPDEALATQPHPILSDVWAGRNHVADELAAASGDPVPVRVRDLDADCDTEDEDTLCLYVGLNHLEKRYVHYGFHRGVDTSDVAEKSAIWQLQVPLSVTPQSVIYPEYLDHYPFANHGTEQDPEDVARYRIACQVAISTPRIFGPTPVEELASIEEEDVFDDAPEE